MNEEYEVTEVDFGQLPKQWGVVAEEDEQSEQSSRQSWWVGRPHKKQHFRFSLQNLNKHEKRQEWK